MSSTSQDAKRKSLFIMVGDLSADRYAAAIITRIHKLHPEVQIWGVGGPRMKETGIELLANCEDFSVVGIVEPLKILHVLKRVMDNLIQQASVRKPDLALLVDSGGFNLKLSHHLRKQLPDLPIYYFISPQIWGSRPWRINLIARTITKMLVIFPFEQPIYAAKGVPVRFVGHPLLKSIPSKDQLLTREEFCRTYGLDPDRPIIAIFSGSRKGEIRNLTPITVTAVKWLLEERPECQFVISKANDRMGEPINQCIEHHKLAHLLGKSLFVLPSQDNYNLMAAADIVWAKSGTTTLEVALFGKPMLIFYRGMWISYWIFSAYKRVKRIGWPNLLAGELLVPELIQLDCRPEQLVRYTRDLLDVPALREEISARLMELRDQLGQGDYISNVAEEVLSALGLSQAEVKSG